MLMSRLSVILVAASILAFGPFLPGHAGETANPLTHGNVQLNLKVGVTTQLEVVETFGAPNITTIDGAANEVWTYQRHATVTSSKKTKGYANIIILGASTASSGFEQSSRTMTLIIKFDDHKIVSDFRSRASSF